MKNMIRDGLGTLVSSDVDEEHQSFIDLALSGYSKEHAQTLVRRYLERQERASSVDDSLISGMEKKGAQLVEDSKTNDSEDENYLSNKYPFFNVMLARSHVKHAYELKIPDNFLPELARVTVPVVLRCGGKSWTMSCIIIGEKMLFCAKWRNFVDDNDLKIGDACVFELRKCSETQMKFKVILLRNDLPPELQRKMQSVGGTQEKPIELD